MWAELHCKLEAVAATVPAASVYLDNRPVKLPWSSTALKRMRKNKDRAWAEFDIDPSDINFSNAMSKQHTFEEEEFKAKVSYEKKITSDLKHNNKAFYAYLRNRRQVKSSVVSLDRGDGTRTDTSAGAAEVLATAFSSVFAREPPGPLPKSVNFEENECVIDDMEVRSSDVKKQLLKLNIFKSSGPDGVHPKLLKSLAYDDSFVEAVTQLFVKCSETGTLPEVWKSASVVALFKKGTKSDPLNYGPVSLTCILCKVYEKLVREHLLDFLEGRISKHQHGFVKGKSCLSNLLETFDNILNLLDEGVPVDLLFFDFSKAFDTVPHFRLLSKLEGFGIKGIVLEIIKDFLTERTMRVCVEGQWSEVKHVLSGVPQGSVLGPLLFILYVNDLPDIVKNKIKLFADDLKLICNANDNRSIADDILELEIWESIWGLKFNPSKCKVVHVNFNNNPNVKYSLNGVELEVSAQEKDLGVITHSSLLWNEQIKTSVSKANQMICWVVRNLINREKNVMLAIYKALIRPHLEYCVQLWNPVAAHGNWATVLELESVQRRFTRLIDEVGTLPYSQRLEILNLTTLAERRIRGDLIEAFKATSGLTDYGSGMNDSNDKKMTDKKADSTRNKVVKSPEKTPSSSDNEFLCPCKKYIGGEFSVGCDQCEKFWHYGCVGLKGLTEEMGRLLENWLCPDCFKSPHSYIESDNEENKALRVIIKEELQLFAPKLTNSLNNVINGSTEKTVNKAVHLYSEVTAKSQKKVIEDLSTAQASENVISKVQTKMHTDAYERNLRKLNLCVLKVPESKKDTSKQRQEGDAKFCLETLKIEKKISLVVIVLVNRIQKSQIIVDH
ncbi:hypothetical protein ACHWQZ_G016501 [Mnemiopsis leidyi]